MKNNPDVETLIHISLLQICEPCCLGFRELCIKSFVSTGRSQVLSQSLKLFPPSIVQLPGVKDPITGKLLRPPGKIRKPKTRDENGNGTPYIHRKTTSLGALGQALHGTMLGIPRDSRENAVQICPICKFQATTKNPYRHLQDHLARVHFKDRIAADLPTKKP